MITLYAWPTPNAQKISILLEELGIKYEAVAVNINKGEQFDPSFLDISPNNRIPAIVDHAPADRGGSVSLFESGAIMLYLAEKESSLLAPMDNFRARSRTLQWLFWQVGGLGPMAGQAHHFRQEMAGEHVPYGIQRYSNEVRRLYEVMESQLEQEEWLGGKEYSIADIACWPWVRPSRRQGIDKKDFPNIKRWFGRISDRPAVQAGMLLLSEHRGIKSISAEAREILFGKHKA
tara:strand:- start:151 stop:849 length:699 start_codon:yes stop_codon:yes gene_type:complete